MTNKLSEHKDFEINTSNLKNVRTFAREVFKKFPELDNQHEELVLALAEAAQNIVKHSYDSIPSTDTMRIQIVYEDKLLTMELFDKGRPVIPANIKPRKLEDIKAGGLGTFFIGQIMDEVIFKTSKTNWINHLILKKKIN